MSLKTRVVELERQVRMQSEMGGGIQNRITSLEAKILGAYVGNPYTTLFTFGTAAARTGGLEERLVRVETAFNRLLDEKAGKCKACKQQKPVDETMKL